MNDPAPEAGNLQPIDLLTHRLVGDFNDVLTAILANLSLAKQQGALVGETLGLMNAAEEAANRGRDITRQLMDLTKGSALVTKGASLKDIILEATGSFLRGSNVRLRCDLPGNLWAVQVSGDQMSRVMRTLLFQGVDHRPAGGDLEVRASNITVNEPSRLPLPAGNYVMISIEDHERGIALADFLNAHLSPQDRDRGLGLAAACAIVKQHGGYISVDSKVGEGATFTVYMPAAPESQEAVSGRESASAIAGKRILFMDDDEAIGDVAGCMLQSLGYEAVITRDGAEALSQYREAQSARRPFAAVILDLSVPRGMGGEETIRELRKLDPNVKAILSSGSYGLPILARYREYGFCHALPKPYGMEDMEQALREVLCPQEASSGSRA